MGTNPVGQLLSEGGFSVGVIGSTPDRDKKLGRYRLTGFGVDQSQSRGVIDKQFLPAAVILAYRVIELFLP